MTNKDSSTKDTPAIDLDPLKDFTKTNFIQAIEKVMSIFMIGIWGQSSVFRSRSRRIFPCYDWKNRKRAH